MWMVVSMGVRYCAVSISSMLIKETSWGSIYALAMPLATSLHVTHVHTTVPDADIHFPPIDPAIWQAVSQSPAETDPATGLSYTYTTYSRKN